MSKPASCRDELYFVMLDPSHDVLCGDFDVRVDFDLTEFPVPVSNRWASFRVSTDEPACWAQHVCPGVTLERYDSGPTAAGYKIWNTNANSSLLGSGDASGKLRVTRTGTVITASYWANGNWTAGNDSTTSADPMVIQFYTGSCSQAPCASEDQVNQSVEWTHLSINSRVAEPAAEGGEGDGALR